MISIILAAGQGTRMRPLSYYIPKILLPVKGKPVLDYLLDNMESLKVDRVYIVASEHNEAIENYLEKTKKENVSIIKGLGWETGGDLAIAFEEIGGFQDAAVMNGDIVTDVQVRELYDFHIRKKAKVSMALFELLDEAETKRFGQVVLDPEDKVRSFKEKVKSEGKINNLVNVGFYIFGKEFIAERSSYMSARKFKLEDDLFPKLANEGTLYGKKMDIKYWWDVGTISSYLKAEQFFINGNGIIPP